MIKKNVAGQYLMVLAIDSSDSSKKTGDATNITAEISKDVGASAATNDVNPTELDPVDHPGVYYFALSQAETNCDIAVVTTVSATANIVLDTYMFYPSDLKTNVDSIKTTVEGTLDANIVQINSIAAAAVLLAESAGAMEEGTIDTTAHTPTITEFEADDITEASNDHYNGRVIIFTAGALSKQATVITDYVLVGGRGQFTVRALTEAPANNDTFIII